MAILGTNIVLYYWNGSTNVAFAAAKNCSFDTANDLVETSSISNAWFKNYSIDNSTWTIKCDGLIITGGFDVKSMLDAQLARTPISIKMTIGTSPSHTISGTANIVTINNTGPLENVATYSISLQGTGRYAVS